MGLPSSKPRLQNPTMLTVVELFNFLCDFRYNFKIVDCRTSIEYIQSHIDTAIHVDDELSPVYMKTTSHVKESLHKLDAIIFYGDSAKSTAFAMLQRKVNQKLMNLQVFELNETFEIFKQQFPFCCSNSDSYYPGMLYASKIDRRIYLSNLGVATNKAVLINLGISHIVNCTVDGPYFDELNPSNDTVSCIVVDPSQQEDSIIIAVSNTNKTKVKDISELIPSQNRYRVPVVDDADQNIQDYFHTTCLFITSALSESPNHNVLIHCKHGQSRSATIAAAWLIATYKYDSGEAIRHLKKCRPRVGPNAGFLEQLRRWETSFLRLETS